ncbi:MAG: aldo/keto reductase family protein [Myxococcota bacterium]|nr:aldo/keto reductase family protein [Myxococcota bacterium]
MKYRRLGRSGLKVSAISIGGWLTAGGSVEEEDFYRILDLATERGVNFIDLADIYARGGAERLVGRWLHQRARHEIVLSSKAFWPMSEGVNNRGLSRKHLFESVEQSLRRLNTDYLDIFFCHRFDPETPLDETVRAMEDLIRQGKILYWGTSVWSAPQIREVQLIAERYGAYAPIVEQPMYNLFERSIESELLPQAEQLGIGVVVWSPLAGGALTGKYLHRIPNESRGAQTRWLEPWLQPEAQKKVRALKEVSERLDCSIATLSLAWLLWREEVSSVITGASHVRQLEENLGALEVSLDEETYREISALFPTGE